MRTCVCVCVGMLVPGVHVHRSSSYSSLLSPRSLRITCECVVFVFVVASLVYYLPLPKTCRSVSLSRVFVQRVCVKRPSPFPRAFPSYTYAYFSFLSLSFRSFLCFFCRRYAAPLSLPPPLPGVEGVAPRCLSVGACVSLCACCVRMCVCDVYSDPKRSCAPPSVHRPPEHKWRLVCGVWTGGWVGVCVVCILPLAFRDMIACCMRRPRTRLALPLIVCVTGRMFLRERSLSE